MVLELDPLAAVDRRVDLRQPRRELPAAGRSGDPEPDRLARVRPQRARPAPGDLLQREPQRLGVRELPVQQRQSGLQSRALGVRERDRRQVEGLRRERIVLLLGEAVGGLVDGEMDAQRVEFGAVRIETPRERILGHVRVALDVAPDLGGGHGTSLRHQIRDQRQLTDELFGVLRQTLRHLRVRAEPYSMRERKFRASVGPGTGRRNKSHASTPCADRGSPSPPGRARAAARARGDRSPGHGRHRRGGLRPRREPRSGRRAGGHPPRRGLRNRTDRAADRLRPGTADRAVHGLERDRAPDQRAGLRRARLRAQGRHAERVGHAR